MHKELCNGISGLCEAMKPTNGAELLKFLRKVNFKGAKLIMVISCDMKINRYCPFSRIER